MIRRAGFATAVLGSLACSGAFNTAMKLGGVNAEFHAGEDVVHPENFPAGAPSGGVPVMSADVTAPRENVQFHGIDVDLTATHYRMQMVQYTLAADALEPALVIAGDQAMAQDWTESPGQEKGTRVFRLEENYFTVLVQQGENDTEGIMLFARLTPVTQPVE